jgi:heme/copper-type cytochrome/quinol oxidase subunit 1
MGAVFAMFAGVYHWYHYFFEKQLNEFLGQLHFWITFIGVNLTFLPMHYLGLAGMARRIPDYPWSYQFWNSLSSYGSIITLLGLAIFCYLLYDTKVQREF